MKTLKNYSLLVTLCSIVLFSCGKNSFKLNEPLTTKKGLEITVSGITEKKEINDPNTPGNVFKPQNGNLYILVEYTVKNPTSSTVDETVSVGLLDPTKKSPDFDFSAASAFEKENYTDNYQPGNNGSSYEGGKMRKNASVYLVNESEWKKEGWKARIICSDNVSGYQSPLPLK